MCILTLLLLTISRIVSALKTLFLYNMLWENIFPSHYKGMCKDRRFELKWAPFMLFSNYLQNVLFIELRYGLNIVPLRFVYAFMRKLCFTLIVSISFWKKYVIGETKIDDWNDRTFGHIAKYRSQRMILDDTLTQDTLA